MPMNLKKEFHITVDAPQVTAVDLLATQSGLSRQKIKQAMQKGCVWLENGTYIQRLRRAKKVLSPGQVLHCYYDEKLLTSNPPAARLVSDEGDYSIWDKPAGMLSQGTKWGDHWTLYRWAETHLQPERPAFIVHRLDRAASGLIIVAHKKQVAAQFATLFRKGDIQKYYAVTVAGDFSNVMVSRDAIHTICTPLDGKASTTHVQFDGYDDDLEQSKLTVKIDTGRKHQIRKHLSGMGFPVVGDRLYSAPNDTDDDLQLRAKSLSFICPIQNIEKNYSI